MLQRLTEKASGWLLESVALHDAILKRIAVPHVEGGRSPEAAALVDAAKIQAAAILTAAIFERAGATGPYDLLEDDPEGQDLLDARRQQTDRAEVDSVRAVEDRRDYDPTINPAA
jgi:hypothetical protein